MKRSTTDPTLPDVCLFVLVFAIAALASRPHFATAAGQWCNGENVTHHSVLTVRSATVGGHAVTPLPTAAYAMTSSPYETDVLSARLFCADCPDQVVARERLERAP